MYAPRWVCSMLAELGRHVPRAVELCDARGGRRRVRLGDPLGLRALVMLSRLEPSNGSGRIDFGLYGGVGRDVVYSIKDLARQVVTVARDRTTGYGGYPRGDVVEQESDVFVADLVGLQFQQRHNSGRLVLLSADGQPRGVLDDEIFRRVVGEPRRTYAQAAADTSGRYVRCGRGELFDTHAYRAFVAGDFVLSCIAVSARAAGTRVNFKFLQYGTGFFAGDYGSEVRQNIVPGVLAGLRRFLAMRVDDAIASFEFPYYEHSREVEELCREHGVGCVFGRWDALRQRGSLMTATTNCANGHAMAGNGMGHGSVDAAIASNLVRRANNLSPVINERMCEEYVDVGGARGE